MRRSDHRARNLTLHDKTQARLIHGTRDDRAPRVRRQAVVWYASRIHPDRKVTGPHAIRQPSPQSPARIERLIKALGDRHAAARLLKLPCPGCGRVY